VAAAVWIGAEKHDGWYGVGPHQLLEDYLHDERVLSLAERIDLVTDPDLTARFPGRFLARVTVETGDGRSLDSGETTFRGEQDLPFSESELRTKYRWLADDLLSAERVKAIEETVFDLPKQERLQPLLDCLAPPPDKLSR
jgi:2-methylcitrate dehydratase PrpD